MTFSELTDYGVLEKPHLSELLDSQDLKVLEERFLTKGTVIVMKDKILQATQIRGSQTAREVWFAPSSLSRTVAAAAKVKASEVYSAGGGFSHVFMNVLGATFMTREGRAEDPAGSMHFKVVLLPAPATAKELESVHVVAMLRGSPVGQPIVVPARQFFLEYVPVGQVPTPGDGSGTSDTLGAFDVAALFPEFFKSLTALGAGTEVHYSGSAVAAYAAVALEGPLATSREEASAAGDKLEQAIADSASPDRASLKLLHRVGAVQSPRPGLGGRVIRQCYFPERLPEVPEGYTGATGEAALAGSEFAEAAFDVPPEPGAVKRLARAESDKDRKARERLEREAAAGRRAVEKQKEKDARSAAERHRQRRRRKQRSGSSSSSNDSDSGGSSSSGSASGRRPPRKRRPQSSHAPPAPPGAADEAMLKSITPPGSDRLQAAAAFFESAALREAARVEELPAGWTPERVPALRRRCALGIATLDRVLGGERWRCRRPNTLADVYVLAEEASAALRDRAPSADRAGATSGNARPRAQRRRSRSPSSSSSSGNKRNKRSKSGTQAGSSAALAPDAAEALNKARDFVEQAFSGRSGRGSASGAVAVLPDGLKDLVRKALTADRVEEGEQKKSRSMLPVVLGRMRKDLTVDIRVALEMCMSADMSDSSELPRMTADKLAGFIRRMDLSIEKAIEAVAEARGPRAPPKGSMLELQDAWALLRAGLEELERTVPVVGRAAERIAAQLSTGAAAQGVSASECREWLKKIFTSLHTAAQDARLDASKSMPTLGEAVAARSRWLEKAVTVVGLKAAVSPAAKHPKEGESGKGREKEPKGKGKGRGGGSPGAGRGAGESSAAVARLWTEKPFIKDADFACMRDKFRAQFPGSCWAAVMFGCKREDCTETHKIPAGFYKLAKECGVTGSKEK